LQDIIDTLRLEELCIFSIVVADNKEEKTNGTKKTLQDFFRSIISCNAEGLKLSFKKKIT